MQSTAGGPETEDAMSNECEQCGHEPAKHCAAHSRELYQCDACGRTLCGQCLCNAAVERGLVRKNEADGIQYPLWECEQCGDVCPECFTDPERA